MKIGAIDVGTNSCRMLIVDYHNGEFKELSRGLTTTRLGEGVDKTGQLKNEAIERTFTAINKYILQMDNSDVDRIAIVGTSALRDVSNPAELINKVADGTGHRLEIISGQEEARLIYMGASLEQVNDDFLIIDIGGGSTEFIWKDRMEINFRSLNIGAVRMTERLITDPAGPVPSGVRTCIKKKVKDIIEHKLSIRKGLQPLGVGGTITTLAGVDLGLSVYDSERIHQHRLSNRVVNEIVENLSHMSLEERKKQPGLQPERADIIIAGILILQVIMEVFEYKSLLVSEHDILYGLVRENI